MANKKGIIASIGPLKEVSPIFRKISFDPITAGIAGTMGMMPPYHTEMNYPAAPRGGVSLKIC